MDYDFVIQQGRIITAHDDFIGDIAIQGEKIAAIGQNLQGKQHLWAEGLYVIPGAIDSHVHLQTPLVGTITADSFEQGSIAAAHGGVTSLVDFVTPARGQNLLEALEKRRAEADDNVVIDYGLHMTLCDPDPKILVQAPAAYEAGCATFKLYMAYPGLYLADDALFLALQAVATAGGLAVIHAENYPVITALWQQFAAADKFAAQWHPHSRPPLAEAEAVNRALTLAHLAEARALIFHISCGEAAAELARAKARGWAAYGETCPHYLTLPDDIYKRAHMPGTWFICQPPIRGAAQAAALWQTISQHTIDIISTDHCPFPKAQKKRGQNNFMETPGGVSGVETRLALMHHFGVQGGHISLNQWVDLCCTRPATLMGIPTKGHLTPGYDADIVLFDPKHSVTYNGDTLHSNIEYSPYQDINVVGVPVTTISRGEIIVQQGEFKGRRGRGQFIKRKFRT